MRTSIRFTGCAVVAMAISLAACKKAEPESAPVTPVKVSPVIKGSIRHIVTAEAVLYPREQANIVPKVSAPVRRFLVSRGDHVKQGQLLAELENKDLVGAAQDSRGQYVQAESNYRTTANAGVPEQVTKAENDVAAAREAMDAAKKLFDSRQLLFQQGALARKLVDEAQVGYAQARAAFESAQQHLDALQSVGKQEQVRAAQAQVESARGKLTSAEAQVEYSSIRSPLTGVVTDRPLYPGEMATTGAPLLSVMDISKVVARINMAQDQAKEVKVGDEATLTEAGSETPIPAKVIVVSPATDPNSTTVQVWVQADNIGERLRPGESVHVAIVAAVLDGATLIPAPAVLANEEGETIVMVVDDKDIAHERPVELGVKEPEMVQVVSGVQPGDRVITEGGVGLEDKSKVRIMKPGEKKPGEKEEPDDEKDGEELMAGEHWTARHGKPIIFVILTLVAIGVYLATTIPVAVFPEVEFPRIIVGVDNGVAPIDQMQVTVTRPIEEALNSVQGLERVQSTTSRGTAEINLFFSWTVDMFQTLTRVNAALARVQPELPPTTKVTADRLTFAAFPIMGYSLTSDTVPQTRMWELATYELKPRLNRMNGVSTIVVQGGQIPEFEVEVDPAKLLQTQITVPNLLDAVGRSNLVDSPGLYEAKHQLVLTLVSGQARSQEDISNIVVKTTPAGAPIRIGDVAKVSPSIRPLYTAVTANTKRAVLLNVFRQPDSNTVAVANAVHAEIDLIRKELPKGIDLQPFYDQSDIVNDSITSVRDAVLIGLVLASLIMVLFLRDWGTSLVAGLVIPATLAVTFIALRALGESFNLMTLGGLAAAVGLVIDDAIVVVENIVMHRDAGEERAEAIRKAIAEIRVPLIGSTITPIVVFLPLISITGVTGTFFKALAITVGMALLTSLALALTWTPTLSHYFLSRRSRRLDQSRIADSELRNAQSEIRNPQPAIRDPQSEIRNVKSEIRNPQSEIHGGVPPRLMRLYEATLRAALARPMLLVAGTLLVVVAAYGSYRLLGSDLLPAMDEGGFILDYIMPAGLSLDETNRVITRVEQILRETPEVESTSRRTGLQLGLAAVTEANTGDIAVRLKRTRSRGSDEVVSEVRQKLHEEMPALDAEFVQLLQDMIGDLTSAPEPIAIKLFSQDPALLRTWAPRVGEAIKKQPGIVDVLNGIENTISGPATMFKVDQAMAARAGFTPQEIELDISAVLQGEPAPTPVVVNDRPYTIRVRFPPSARASVDAMKSTLLVSSTGRTGTLGELATVEEIPGQTEVRRENLQRNVTVTARLEGVDLGAGVAEAQRAIAELNMPPSIRVEYGGAYEEQQRSFHDLMIVLVLAVLLVFTVLLFEFGGFAAPVAVMASALLSTVGVFLALLVTGTTFNLSSFMGLIMVIGIVAKNGILLLDADQRFRAEGMSPEESMIQAGERRLRPIMMTALATVAGMIPLALGWGAGSQMLQPLAIAVIGGILASMVLSLVITPTVHYYLATSD